MLAMLIGGAALIIGALLLWTARRRMIVGAALGLVVLGGVGGVPAIAAEIRTENRRMSEEDRLGGAAFDEPIARGPRLTKAEAEAVPMGLTRKRVRQRLGPPASYKEVALELGISPKTVEHHVSAVLHKLQLTNRHQLSRWAADRRMLD